MARSTADPVSERKSYGQVCPLTVALDIVGDRWTILILRELLGGAARFHELSDGLPGIASNLLTERLRRLEADGVVRRIDTHGVVLYALTEHGAGIRTALEELGMWGAGLKRVCPAEHGRSIRSTAMALQALLARAGDALPSRRAVIEMDVDGELLEIVLDQRPSVAARPSTEPDARVHVSVSGIADVLMGQTGDTSVITHVAGDEAAAAQLIAALGGATWGGADAGDSGT